MFDKSIPLVFDALPHVLWGLLLRLQRGEKTYNGMKECELTIKLCHSEGISRGYTTAHIKNNFFLKN